MQFIGLMHYTYIVKDGSGGIKVYQLLNKSNWPLEEVG